MALVVEDGTGKSDAESYISVADTTTYLTKVGKNIDWEALVSDTLREVALKKAAQYLDLAYHNKWLSTRTNELQALAWPRWATIDRDGWSIEPDEIPTKLKYACAEAAFLGLTETLLPDISDPGAVKSESITVGPIRTSTTYAGTNPPIKKFRTIDLLLQDFILLISGGVYRA